MLRILISIIIVDRVCCFPLSWFSPTHSNLFLPKIVHFILGDFAKAAEDYSQSSSLDESFVFSHIQLAVAQYKAENVANSMATFRRTLKAFPERSEPQNY